MFIVVVACVPVFCFVWSVCIGFVCLWCVYCFDGLVVCDPFCYVYIHVLCVLVPRCLVLFFFRVLNVVLLVCV